MIFTKPDYAAFRTEAKLHWSVTATYYSFLELTDIPIRDYFLKPECGIELYKRGRELVRERFGPEVRLPGLATPHVSYGHVNGLGAELTFPEGGEVGHEHLCGSIEEGMRLPNGFIFSPGCDLPPRSPLENVMMMNKAVNDFVWY